MTLRKPLGRTGDVAIRGYRSVASGVLHSDFAAILDLQASARTRAATLEVMPRCDNPTGRAGSVLPVAGTHGNPIGTAPLAAIRDTREYFKAFDFEPGQIYGRRGHMFTVGASLGNRQVLEVS